MRLAAFFLVAFFCASASANVRILVTPLPGSADDDTARGLSRAVETALANAIDHVEIVTPAAIDTAVELDSARACAGEIGDAKDGGISSCMTELADAIDVDFIARPQLSKIGDELLLTLTLIDGERAVVVAQGQRRADVDSPAALLDQIPGLARAIADDADLAHARRRRAVPVVPIVVAGAGVVVAGAGVVALAVRGGLTDGYQRGSLGRNDARFYEFIDAPFFYGGLSAVVVGGVAAVTATGVAVWSALGPEE